MFELVEIAALSWSVASEQVICLGQGVSSGAEFVLAEIMVLAGSMDLKPSVQDTGVVSSTADVLCVVWHLTRSQALSQGPRSCLLWSEGLRTHSIHVQKS